VNSLSWSFQVQVQDNLHTYYFLDAVDVYYEEDNYNKVVNSVLCKTDVVRMLYNDVSTN